MVGGYVKCFEFRQRKKKVILQATGQAWGCFFSTMDEPNFINQEQQNYSRLKVQSKNSSGLRNCLAGMNTKGQPTVNKDPLQFHTVQPNVYTNES